MGHVVVVVVVVVVVGAGSEPECTGFGGRRGFARPTGTEARGRCKAGVVREMGFEPTNS